MESFGSYALEYMLMKLCIGFLDLQSKSAKQRTMVAWMFCELLTFRGRGGWERAVMRVGMVDSCGAV